MAGANAHIEVAPDPVILPPTPPEVAFFKPAPELRDLVTSYYTVSSTGPLLDYLHPEWANIRFALKGVWTTTMAARHTATPRLAGLYGPTDRTSRFETASGTLLGIGFTPIGWARLIGGDASAFANDLRELDNALGIDGNALARALTSDADPQARVMRLDSVFMARLAGSPSPDFRIRTIQDALAAEHIVDVEGFADCCGMPKRTLHRLCQTTFGFGPKRLLKRQRFLRTL